MTMTQIASPTYQVYGAANSMQGGRPENQDDFGFLETPLGFALVVCDGMGGGPGGKTASYIAKYEFLTTLSKCGEQMPPATALKMAVSRANDALEEKMMQVPELRGMGSTLVGILINRQSALIAHLGDSRCYQLRGKKVKFRTQDHSLVGELVRSKAITEEQARVSPQSNVITRGLGNTSNHVADIDEVPYQKGDRFVLCTDGVWGIMPQEDLLVRLTAMVDTSSKVANMSAEIDRIGFASGGRHDNHTLVILETNTDSILKEKMSKQVKIIIAVLSALLAISIVFNIVCLIKMGNHSQTGILAEEVNINPQPIDENAGSSSPKEIIEEDNQDDQPLIIGEEIDAKKKQIGLITQRQDSASTKDSSKSNQDGQTLEQLIDQLVSQLNTLKDINEKEQSEAIKKSKSCTDNVKQLLSKLKTKVPEQQVQTIESIEKIINGDAFDCTKNIWPKGKNPKRYVMASPTQTVIGKEILPKVEKIKNHQ